MLCSLVCFYMHHQWSTICRNCIRVLGCTNSSKDFSLLCIVFLHLFEYVQSHNQEIHSLFFFARSWFFAWSPWKSCLLIQGCRYSLNLGMQLLYPKYQHSVHYTSSSFLFWLKLELKASLEQKAGRIHKFNFLSNYKGEFLISTCTETTSLNEQIPSLIFYSINLSLFLFP